jgi:hypothetical protein
VGKVEYEAATEPLNTKDQTPNTKDQKPGDKNQTSNTKEQKPITEYKKPEATEQELKGDADTAVDQAKRVVELEKAAASASERMAKLDGSLKQAVESYRALVIKANPEVLPELISGDSIEALEGSLANAKELTGKIKAGLETQAAAIKVPAGAPARGAPDGAGLSAREKIRMGIGRGNG